MDTFWVWHLIMFNMVQGWRTSLPPVYHTESPATWILGQLRLSILLINREKQNKTNKQKKARKREKKVKTSFRESVLQFRKIMVGPPDWHKFLRNRLRIMLPFRYMTLRVRVFYLYLHNSSGIQWGFPDSLLWPVSLPSASPRDERFLAREEVSRPWATRAGGGLKGVWHWLFLTEPPQTSSRLVPNFPAGREMCVM